MIKTSFLSIGCLLVVLCCAGCGAHVGGSYPIGPARVGMSVPVFRWWGNRILHYQTIFEAAENGDTYDIKTHLKRGVAVNAHNSSGKTPLHLAAENGHYKASKYLISKGANVNGLDNQNMSPYDYADKNYHQDVKELLAEHGGK